MTPDHVPSLVHTDAMESLCSDTVGGWLWYCDAHDAHGNADHEEEAYALASAHAAFQSANTGDDESCDIVIWLRTPYERSTHPA